MSASGLIRPGDLIRSSATRSDEAPPHVRASRPRVPEMHVSRGSGADPSFLFVVDGSQVYEIASEAAAEIWEAQAAGSAESLFRDLGIRARTQIGLPPVVAQPVRAISLAVAQTCNLSCTYCYAQEGDFGGPAQQMSAEVARKAIDRLFAGAGPGDKGVVAFMGGEPLINRTVVRDATEYAERKAQETGASVAFSITTNGTLLTPHDADFFEKHGFAVSISLDGVGEAHDALRPFRSGMGSFDRIMSRVSVLLETQRRMQVSARVTVTPQNLDVRSTVDGLVSMGFHSVGVSPMLSSPNGRNQMQGSQLLVMLDQMIECGRAFESAIASDRRYPFSNMASAMQEIHMGSCRATPCGAGKSYLGVSAEGDFYACHRFVNDERASMGNVDRGPDDESRNAWLGERSALSHEPCRSCWARHLCGGGCHHEVVNRGRPGCDFIRGWLHYCLQAYIRLTKVKPSYFGLPEVAEARRSA